MAKKPKGSAGLRRKADIIDDPARPLLQGIEAVAARPGKPLTAAQRRAYEREKASMRQAMLDRAAVRKAERLARLARRPAAMQAAGYRLPADLPPLNVTTFRERISGGVTQGRATDATRKEVRGGADHREAPRG